MTNNNAMNTSCDLWQLPHLGSGALSSCAEAARACPQAQALSAENWAHQNSSLLHRIDAASSSWEKEEHETKHHFPILIVFS